VADYNEFNKLMRYFQVKALIDQQHPRTEFMTPEGCYIIEIFNTPDDTDASIARARVAPGAATRLHRLKGTTERYFIVSGEGRMEVGNLPPRNVQAGDVVLIPPLCRQRITSTGTEDLIFLAICTPRFLKDCYEDIDENPM
jgi:mannose-6-phosphate isomerase-like protein (cupin superfamily)